MGTKIVINPFNEQGFQLIPTREVATDLEMKRVDNNVFETAQTGVEYFAPVQHGGIFGGTIFRRYYAIPDAAGTGDTKNIAMGFTLTGRIVDLRGVALRQNGNDWQPLPFVDFGSATDNLELVCIPPNIQMHAGSGQDWLAGGFLWLDYTK